MQIAFCTNCGKRTGHKRSIGVGTALGAVVTGGASLLAVPAYGKRCVICGLTESEAATPAVRPTQQSLDDTALGMLWLKRIFLGFAVIIIYLIVTSKHL